MSGLCWVLPAALLALHEESLSKFGGASGLRDRGLLESALQRPENLAFYEPEATVFRVAAAYTFGIAKNHPFLDGNKRTAFLAAVIFLALNGMRLRADPIEAADAVLAIVDGSMDEVSFGAWLQTHCEYVETA